MPICADLPWVPQCPTRPFAHRPMLIDMSKVYRQTNLENLDQAFSVAERDLGVTRLLDPEGACPSPCPLSPPCSLHPLLTPAPPTQMWMSLSLTRSPSSPTSPPCTTRCPEYLTCRMG